MTDIHLKSQHRAAWTHCFLWELHVTASYYSKGRSSATRANDFTSKDIQDFRSAKVIKEEKEKKNEREIVQSMSAFTFLIHNYFFFIGIEKESLKVSL